MTFKHTLMAASVMGAFALSGPVMALTKVEIKSESDNIARQFKSAKALQINALADAKADLKIGDAYKSADDKAAVMRKDAADDKRDANYAASRERCDKYAGDVMNRCIADAKLQFGMK